MQAAGALEASGEMGVRAADAVSDGAPAEGPGSGRARRLAEMRLVSVGPVRGRVGRVWWLAGILAVECVPITAMPHPWLTAKTFAADGIFFCLAMLVFGGARLRRGGWGGGYRAGFGVANTAKDRAIDVRFAGLHVGALAVFFAAGFSLLTLATDGAMRGGGWERVAVGVWYGALGLIPVTLAGALFGSRLRSSSSSSSRVSWRGVGSMVVGLGSAWGFAAGCGVLTMAVRRLLQMAWDAPGSWIGQAMQATTFRGVAWLLGWFYPDLVCDPGSAVLGTDRFLVRIGVQCSGIEGLALMLGLAVGWIVYARRELRVGRAMLVVGPALGVVFLLNIARIAALVAIGDAGYGAVALGGFHSEAGWILFSGVALGFLAVVNRVRWFQRVGVGGPVAVECGRNVAAVYLLPLLAMVAAALLVQAGSSGGFEAMYGLRVIAVLGVGYCFRREYRGMDWRFGWVGVAAGVVVFGCWVGLGHWIGVGAGSGVAAGLARLTEGQRVGWILLRVIGAVVVAPFAEELAFRGFLARRLMADSDFDVESVSLRRLSVVAVVGSSLVFGLLHGRMWLAGMVAGVVFCLVARVRGRLGEAVAAHATANLLIAAWVLARGDYSLW